MSVEFKKLFAMSFLVLRNTTKERLKGDEFFIENKRPSPVQFKLCKLLFVKVADFFHRSTLVDNKAIQCILTSFKVNVISI